MLADAFDTMDNEFYVIRINGSIVGHFPYYGHEPIESVELIKASRVRLCNIGSLAAMSLPMLIKFFVSYQPRVKY